MENNKPRTIDEFFIEKYQKLEEENQDLKQELETYKAIEKAQDENIEFWKNKYYELIKRIKEDFGFELRYASAFPDELIINSKVIIWENSDKEKFEYYKIIFNLKMQEQEQEQEQEGERENE